MDERKHKRREGPFYQMTDLTDVRGNLGKRVLRWTWPYGVIAPQLLCSSEWVRTGTVCRRVVLMRASMSVGPPWLCRHWVDS